MAQAAPGRSNRKNFIFALAVGLAGLPVMAALVTLASRGDEQRDAAPAGVYRGSEPPVRFSLPVFDLPSHDGRRVSSAGLRGRVVLLTLLDSQCTETCPILASTIARTLDRLRPTERESVRVIAVSGDPVEDTRASVRRFLAAQHAERSLDYLVGTERELRPVWTELRLLPSLDTGRDTLHSAPLRIYDRSGVWVATLHAGVDLSEENLLHDIRFALASEEETSR